MRYALRSDRINAKQVSRFNSLRVDLGRASRFDFRWHQVFSFASVCIVMSITVQLDLSDALVKEARANGFDEVVLLNERDEVSELTSANIFAVFGNDVVTPPISSGCLPGVTRALLLEEVSVPGITIREAVLTPADLEKADEIFITSSTRDLLPVRHIDSLDIHQGDRVTPVLNHAFQHLLASYCTRA